MPDYCETLVRKSDYDRYISALFAPEKLRSHLFALYALNYEIGRIAEIVGNPMAGQLRLQWWRDAVAEIFSGAPGRTEALKAIALAVRARALPKQLFDHILEAREQDFETTPFPDFAALEAYAEATSGGLMRLAARVLGAGDTLDEQARAAGIAYGITGLLRSLAFNAARGRVVVPLEEIRRTGAETSEILRGHMSEPLSTLFIRMAEVARRHYSSVYRTDRKFLPAILPASLVPRLLHMMTRRGFDLFRDSSDVPGYRRQWTMLVAVARGRI